MAAHLHFAIYDKDMYSFSPYLLGGVFKDRIDYQNASKFTNVSTDTTVTVKTNIKNLSDYRNGDDNSDGGDLDVQPINIPPSITIKNNYVIRWLITNKIDFSLFATGSEPITWSKISGSLPSGVKVNENGSITGKAAKTGKFTFTVQAKNSADTDSKTLILDIYEAGELPSITTTSIKDAEIDKSYSVTVKASGRKITKWTASGFPRGLGINATSGKISGTPTQSGTFNLKITAKNELGSVSQNFSLNVCKEPSITTNSIPSTAYTYEKYSGVIFQSDATPAPTWSVTVLSSLPPGLKINKNTGELSGTPTTKGTYNFTVKATNKIGSDTKKFKIVVKVGDPQITTKSLPGGKVGVAYETQLAGNNLPSGSAWAANSILPAGLTLSKTGLLSGTPVRAGTYDIYAMAINKQGISTTKIFSLKITGTIKITTAAKLDDAEVGKKYKITLKASGATSYTWCATSPLPVGLTLSKTGVLSGTPVHASDNATIYVRVLDSYGGYTDKTFSLKIIDGLAISTKTLKDTAVGQSYKVTLKAKSSTAVTWLATSTLPYGLKLSSKGVLSGTPTHSGKYTIYVRALNAYGNYVDKNFELNIFGAPSITTTKLKNATVGKSYEHKFEGTCSTDIKWCATSQLPPGLMLTSDGVLSGIPHCTGNYTVYVSAINSYGEYVDKNFDLSIGGNEKNSATVFNDITVGKKYENSFWISFPDTGNIKFSKSGTMPKGLSLSLKGTNVYVKGTPKESGIFRVKVTLKDEAGASVYQYISLTVHDTLKITTGKTLTNGKTYKKYSKQLKATGSDSFVWHEYWGLVSGLTLSPSGVISGTPLYAYQNDDFLAAAFTPYGTCVEKEFYINIDETELAITTSEDLPPGETYKKYSTTLKATGLDSFVWRYGWNLPTGLTLSPSGVISGTPLYEGEEYYFYAQAFTPYGTYVEKVFYITIEDNLSITTKETLPDGNVGNTYKQTLKAKGLDSFVWRDGWNLPSGLTLSPSGVLSGTPLHVGKEYCFYAQAFTPYGTYVAKVFYITIYDSSKDSSKSKSKSSPSETQTENQNGNVENEIDTQQNQPSEQIEQNQIDTLITERGTSALNDEILRGFKNDGYIVAAMLPKIEVTDEGMHDFTVSLDKNVPVGSKLLWRSLPLNGANIDDDDDSALFANLNGEEISTSPEDFNVIVSAWLRTDTAYEPVILAEPDRSTEKNSSSGCNVGAFGIVLLLMSIGVIKGKN